MSPPAPSAWACHDGSNVDISKLPNVHDKDLKTVGKDVGACETTCKGTAMCVAVVWHEDDHHCHVLLGNASHAQLEAALKKELFYQTCFAAA